MPVATAPIEKRVDRVNYPWELDFCCPICGEKVSYCFSNKKHDYIDFDEEIREFRYQYTCTNAQCSMQNVLFNPAPLNVIPGKGYSLAVWKWIAKEHFIHEQKPRQIVARLLDAHDIEISESTVRRYIKEIEVYVAGNIDANTASIIKAQGRILLSLDGQEPDDEGPALWLFVDVLSNRVLRAVLLESANHEVLYGHVQGILSQHGAELVGMISDKQGSIVKMHDKYFQDVPHQYCHFHFLQNMWNHLELRDGHLQKELSKFINRLYITSTSVKNTKILESGERVKVRDIFKEVEKNLKKVVKTRSKKLEHLRGIEAFKNIEEYVQKIEEKCHGEDPDRYVVKWLLETARQLREKLAELAPSNEEHVEMNARFQEVRAILGNPRLAKNEKVAILDGICKDAWDEAHVRAGIERRDQLRTFLPKISSSRDKIILEWVRLYGSYKRGLFAYYEFPVPERTNSPMEKKFGQEKMQLFTRCGKKRVGMQVRLRGPMILKGLYAGKTEIKAIIDEIDQETSFEQIKVGIEELAQRTKEETERWRSRVDADESISRVLERGRTDLDD